MSMEGYLIREYNESMEDKKRKRYDILYFVMSFGKILCYTCRDGDLIDDIDLSGCALKLYALNGSNNYNNRRKQKIYPNSFILQKKRIITNESGKRYLQDKAERITFIASTKDDKNAWAQALHGWQRQFWPDRKVNKIINGVELTENQTEIYYEEQLHSLTKIVKEINEYYNNIHLHNPNEDIFRKITRSRSLRPSLVSTIISRVKKNLNFGFRSSRKMSTSSENNINPYIISSKNEEIKNSVSLPEPNIDLVLQMKQKPLNV